MLEVSGLNIDLGGMRILHDVSLTVADGEIVAVIGSNGSGKTTLLRALAGLVRIASGTIKLAGKDITNMAPDKIVKAGMSQIPERGRVFPHMTVLEHLQLGAWTQRRSRDVQDSLEKVYQFFPVLRERRRQAAGTLSGGERQMIAIGRGLMSRPRILLLDEPTLGLAPILCQRLGEIVQGLNKLGTAILLVEQNATLALAISHRAYVLETGKVALQGRSSDLAKDPAVKRAYLGLD